jgi:serine/threonine protein kinase/predicted protein tyrosine phosphatase
VNGGDTHATDPVSASVATSAASQSSHRTQPHQASPTGSAPPNRTNTGLDLRALSTSHAEGGVSGTAPPGYGLESPGRKRRKSLWFANDAALTLKYIHNSEHQRTILQRRSGTAGILGPSYLGTVTVEKQDLEIRCAVKEILMSLPVVQAAAEGAFCAPSAAVRELGEHLEAVRQVQSPYLGEIVMTKLDETKLTVVSAVFANGTASSVYNLRGTITAECLWQLLRDVLSGLTRLHSVGLFHGNLKLDNIILDTESEHFVLVDAGYGKLLEHVPRHKLYNDLGVTSQSYYPPESVIRREEVATNPLAPNLQVISPSGSINHAQNPPPSNNSSGVILRVPSTASEASTASTQASWQNEGEKLRQKADMWALGVITYELIFGHEPFQCGPSDDVFRRITDMSPFCPITFARPGLQMNPSLQSFVLALLDKNPDTRPQASDTLRHPYLRRNKDLLSTRDPSLPAPMNVPQDDELVFSIPRPVADEDAANQSNRVPSFQMAPRTDMGIVEDVCIVNEDFPCSSCEGRIVPLAFQCISCPHFVLCSKCYQKQDYTHDPSHLFTTVVVEEMTDRKMSVSLGLLGSHTTTSQVGPDAFALRPNVTLQYDDDDEEDEDVESMSTSQSPRDSALRPMGAKSLVLVNTNVLSPHERAVFGMTGQLPESKLAALKSLDRHLSLSQKRASTSHLSSSTLESPRNDSMKSPTVNNLQPAGASTEDKEKVRPMNRVLGGAPQLLCAPEDDYTVEDIIQDCINGDSSMLLNGMKLSEVPMAVYAPPLIHVVELDLSSNSLRSIPEEISRLVGLQKLLLGNNKLTSLPNQIGDLTELRVLEVHHNMLEDLPQTLMFIDKLETLAMDYNNCTAFPSVILDIPSLHTIYLASNYGIKSWPPIEEMRALGTCKIGMDNEPHLYRKWIDTMERALPNIQVLWHKIYPDMIIQNMYCGSLRSAQTPLVYEALKIKHILSMGRGLEPVVLPGMTQLSINVDDIEGANIEETFVEAVEFIDKALSAGEGCLVHCFAGMSRSATACIAYLMIKRGMRLDEAYLATKRGRPAIYPNQGFFQQLQKLDARLFPGARPLDMESMDRGNVPIG